MRHLLSSNQTPLCSFGHFMPEIRPLRCFSSSHKVLRLCGSPVFLGRLFLGKLLFRLLHLFGDRGLAGLGLIQHLAGVFRKTGGHSVRLPGLEEQQVFPRFSLIKGIVHIPLPGYPVKEFCIPGQFKAVGGCAVRHEFFHGLLAVWRLLCPVCLGNFASHRPNNIGKPPSGQLRRLYRYGDRAPGNIFVYQPSSPPFTVIKW